MYVYSSSVECVFKNQNESSIKNRKKRKIEIEIKKPGSSVKIEKKGK